MAETSEAQLHITKLNAARRQIDSAIRLFFLGEDIIVPYVLAANAQNICSDILKRRGKSHPSLFVVWGAFYVIRDGLDGSLPDNLLTTYDFFNKKLPHIIELVRSGCTVGEFENSVRVEVPRSFIGQERKVVNYLKHADRDHKTMLPEKKVDVFNCIEKAATLYTHILPEFSIEMIAFLAYQVKLGVSRREAEFPDLIKIAMDIEDEGLFRAALF